MHSPSSLLAIAEAAEFNYHHLLADHPPGTYHEGRNTARDDMWHALICAAWMEDNGFGKLMNVGPFMAFRVEKGRKIRICKGAVIYSTNPGHPRHGKICGRPYQAIVHDMWDGYIDVMNRGTHQRPAVIQSTVHWVGSGGYWCWTDANNVELVD